MEFSVGIEEKRAVRTPVLDTVGKGWHLTRVGAVGKESRGKGKRVDWAWNAGMRESLGPLFHCLSESIPFPHPQSPG